MPAGHLAYNFRRRLIVDAFVGDTTRRRLRGALDNDTLDALVDRAARVVLVHFLAPHAGQLGLCGQGTHGSSGAALLGHSLGTDGLGFGNQALNRHPRVRGRCGSCLLMNGKLLFLRSSVAAVGAMADLCSGCPQSSPTDLPFPSIRYSLRATISRNRMQHQETKGICAPKSWTETLRVIGRSGSISG